MPSLHGPSTQPPVRPGLLLSFDDAGNIPYWHRAMELLGRHGAHVTFFVDKFDQLKPEDVQMLRDLRAAGHAIGCHSLRHFSASRYARDHGMLRYLMADIEPAIAAMHARGFDAHSFAYPNSLHDDQTDAALARYFSRLRSGVRNTQSQPLASCDGLFTPLAHLAQQRTMLGTGIDSITGRCGRPSPALQPKARSSRSTPIASKPMACQPPGLG